MGRIKSYNTHNTLIISMIGMRTIKELLDASVQQAV